MSTKVNHLQENKAYRNVATSFMPIYYVSRILGLAPYTFPEFQQSTPASFYTLCITIIIAVGFFWSMKVALFDYLADYIVKRWLLPRIIMFFFSGLAALLALTFAGFNSGKTMAKVKDKFATVDSAISFGKVRNYALETWYVRAEFLIMSIACFVVIPIDFYITSLANPKYYYLNGVRLSIFLITEFMVLLFINLVMSVRLRYDVINEELSYLFALNVVDLFVVLRVDNNRKHRVAILRKAHLRMFQVAETLNRYFGMKILFQITSTLINTVSYMHAILDGLRAFGQKQETEAGELIDFLFCFVSVLWVVFSIFELLVIANVCDAASARAKKTAFILQRSSLVENATREEVEELQRFCDQIANNKMTFTACGLFNLDLTMILSIVGTVATYTIIMEQQPGESMLAATQKG